jgi:DNA-binding LacI/PurR family transcriptional regulator
VWHVAGPQDWLEAQARVAGWKHVLEGTGRSLPPLLYGDWSPRSGHEAGEILARTKELSAVFVANDQMALGLLRAFRQHGIRVPEDVAVVGYDDIPEAAYFAPPLTTIRQDFDEVGRASIGLLLGMIDAEAPTDSSRRVITPSLIVRESTAPAG